MICVICNFKNQDNNTYCEKCGNHLFHANNHHFELDNSKKLSQPDSNGEAKATIHGIPLVNTNPHIRENQCSHCGYLMVIDATCCPNCGQAPNQKTKIEGRFRPYTKKIEEFQPLKNESINLITLAPLNDTTLNTVRLNGSQATISRQDIDISDQSISQDKHVEFFQIDGVWHIKNVSSNGAVFIQIKDDMPIKSGDIIQIGMNKIYKIEI